MSSVERAGLRRPLVADLNPNLMCRLCGGYYVDAAAIIECLHTFCKSCLVRYLETNKYCPVCDVQVHKSRPLQNIRLDPTLQDMVYKLVPGLYHKEMKWRREFYATRADAPLSSPEDRGDIPPELCPFYTPDEPVSLVLEYRSPETQDGHTTNLKDSQHKRFLRCPAAVKITHLEKLLRNKYGLDNRYNIDLMLEDSKLAPDLTLMDVAYAFGRKRKGQFLFTYRIYDTQCKKMRLSGDVCEMDTLPPPADVISEVKKELETVKSVDAKLSSSEPQSVTTSTATCVVTSLPAPVMTTPSVTTPVSSAPVSMPLNSFSNTTITPVVLSVSPASYPVTCVVTSVTPATFSASAATFGLPAITAAASARTAAATVTVTAARTTPTAAPATTARTPTTTAPASTTIAATPTTTAAAPTTTAATPTTTAAAPTTKVAATTTTAATPTTTAAAPTSKAAAPTTKAAAPTTTAAAPTTIAATSTTTAAAPATIAVATTSIAATSATIAATSATIAATSATITASPAIASATTAVATSTKRAAASTSTLTITPVTTSAISSTKSNTLASSLLMTTAPSLKVSVQRLNPATVKSVTGKYLPEKTTNLAAQPSATSADKSNKLDSIISRLGDASKHPRPEASSGPAPKKDYSSSRKSQGKEVQLRISENGEMSTNVVHADKPSSPLPKPATPLPPVSPAAKPTPKISHSTKSSENSTSSESAPKQGAVAPLSPGGASTRKPNSSPVGYKTLKSGPKGWNPTISRNSFLSAKLEQQQQQQLQKAQQQSKDSAAGTTKSPTPEPVVKPPRFFKARNTPRYLGNPASGVKPMYQIASPPPSVQKPTPPSKPPPKPPSKPSALLKLDPKTLTPIMTSVASAVGSPTSQQTSQGKDRPPFLSTTISGSHNHSPSSRGVTTTSTSTAENSSKMSSAELAMRNAPSPHPIMRFLSMCDPMNPFSPRLGDPNRIPTSPPYASLLRAPFSPLLVNSYGLSQPPPVGMLYNQSLHRQVNHTGPLSPVPGLPSPLAPTSSLLPPSSSPKNVLSPGQWGPASPSSPTPKVPVSPQPMPNKKFSTEVQPKTADKQAKLNGEKSQVKDKSTKDVPVKHAADGDKKEGERKSSSVKETTKEAKGPEQDNNNTVVVEKKSLKSDESVVEQSLQLSHNISKLCSPTASAKESPASKVHNS